MKDEIKKEIPEIGLLGGEASGSNHQPLICVDCSPLPLDHTTVVTFRVLKIGVEHAESKHKPNMDIAQCPKCGKKIAY